MRCQSRKLWNCCLMEGVDMPTLGLPNMFSHSKNEIWPVRAGICEIAILWAADLPTLGLPNISCQSRNIENCNFGRGYTCQHLVCPIWVLTVGMKYNLSEKESVKLTFYMGVDLPTPGLPNRSFHIRNKIGPVREGICDINILQGGRSANTWPV